MYKNIINDINLSKIRKDIPNIKSGNFVEVKFFYDKLRNKLQIFNGLVISVRNKNFLSTIIVRKISFNEGVEKTFFIHSPNIFSINIYKKINVRKSKLFYIRNIKRKSL